MQRNNTYTILAVILIPLLLVLLLRWFFGADIFGGLFLVMSFSFVALVPVGVGALTIALSEREKVERLSYRLMMPWVPILAFFLITLFFGIEGWACWIMVLPLFMACSSLGGYLAGRFKLRDKNDEKIFVSLIVLLPLLVAPLEQLIGRIPGQYKAYTYIDIKAQKENIWKHVTRVSAIPEQQDKGWFTRFLGFPRPIKAELDFEGVGGYRKAIFDKGLIFDETVTAYEHQKSMRFTIKADPCNIPSTTMDEHVVIGGKYFDVLDGTYELEPLSGGICRLHLYSHFKLATSFNFYASWWASWIMKDIQQNILQVIRHRAEGQ
ncbi:SRPBCC family protein [Chitinophaga sp. Mgbs1]|uniref:SRPBCC family protein n=1 Tax=Chitinophaga solisilvae TaxID=1233460 RepID=A0A433WM38_9BACT|nr:SRPBCC family protein [Chitinophaga solisilvae]